MSSPPWPCPFRLIKSDMRKKCFQFHTIKRHLKCSPRDVLTFRWMHAPPHDPSLTPHKPPEHENIMSWGLVSVLTMMMLFRVFTPSRMDSVFLLSFSLPPILCFLSTLTCNMDGETPVLIYVWVSHRAELKCQLRGTKSHFLLCSIVWPDSGIHPVVAGIWQMYGTQFSNYQCVSCAIMCCLPAYYNVPSAI